MNQYVGRLLEFRLEAGGRPSARVHCPSKAIPRPGQYLLADHPGDADSVLSAPLFPQKFYTDGFLAVPAAGPAERWPLGSELYLRGPLGKGFNLPGTVRNLALADLAGSPAYLLSLLPLGQNITLFTDAPHAGLPVDVEVQPLAGLPDAAGWADFTAAVLLVDSLTPSGSHPGLRQAFGLSEFQGFPAPGQALVLGPMPCGGLADCGVCALRAGKGYKLACKDGPVFSLNTLQATA